MDPDGPPGPPIDALQPCKDIAWLA